MKLSEIYTTDTVARSVGSIAPVCTRTIDEMYTDVGMEFDTSILLCNGSTSELLNNGAYGNNFTAYTTNGVLQNGETTSQINFLGCAIVRGLDTENPLNLSKKIVSKGDIYDITWDDVKNLRFVINVVSSEGISESKYQPFDITTTSNVIYDFNSTFVESNFNYSKQNAFLSKTGFVNNPLSLTGDDAKRIYGVQFTVNASTYNKYMNDSDNISKQKIGDLCYIYLINNEYFLLKSPISMPDSGYDHKAFTIDTVKNYLTIGGFSDFENGNTGFLPETDETKGAYPYTQTVSGSYKQACNYYVTANCSLYVLNSCGLRWVLTSNVTTSKNFRDNVCLGKMDANGIINHKEWIIGETAIQSSDNPNKDTSYDNIPDRNNNSGDLNDDIDDTLLGRDLYVNGFVNYFQVTAGNLTDISTAISNETEKTGLLNNVISLKSYVVPTSAFLSAGSTVSAPIKLNGVTVLESAPKIVAHSMKFHIGDYTINGRYGNLSNPHFLDKNPYTIIELYIPFCGIVTLPDKCMYNTISVDLSSDLFSGGCKAVVKCNGAIVAEKSGIIGYDIPLSSLNTAELSHALLNNVLKSVDIGTNTIISGATGNIGGILSGTMSGVNNMLSMYHTVNQNYTSIVGKSGAKSEYALPPQCYVKITTKIVKYPDNYSHTVGKPCYKTKKLSDCKGFTMCENVNINVSSTGTEKQMIKQLLETGIYI